MEQELSTILSFRRVLEMTGDGMGVSQSLVQELRGARAPRSEVCRRLLLGYPLEVALLPITSGPSAEASMLASLLLSSKHGSVVMTGKKGETLSHLAESWVKARENKRMEDRIRRARGLLASAVAGAVSSMLATIGPLLGSLPTLGASPGPAPVSLLFPGAALAMISSGILGVYTSGRKFYVNLLVTGIVYGLVSFAVAPLAAFPSTAWAIK